jgi:phage terminase large subunit
MGEVNEIYQPIYTSPNRYFLVTGGRGSLKSTTIHDFVVRLTYEKGEGILFTRYTMASAEKSIIPEFKLTLSRLNVEHVFEVTKSKIVNKLTGSFIVFSGIKTNSGDQTANLKSISGITCWIIEEGEDYNDERSFDSIDDSIRTIEKQNRVIWIQNPSTKEHFIYKRWLDGSGKYIEIEGQRVTISDRPEVTHIHSWYGIAKHYLSKDWLEKAERVKKENPKWYYHNYIGGWLERAEGAIFTNWITGEFDNSLPYCYGQDYGFSVDPTTLVKVAVDNKLKIIYAEELLYSQSGMGTDAIFEANKRLIHKPNDLIIADSAEPRLIDELSRKGLNIRGAVKGQGSVTAGITQMQDYKIVITPQSTNLKKELSNYCWSDKRAGIPIDDYNHCFTGETLITTINGQVPIKDIQEGDLVLTSQGYKKVLVKFNNGLKQVKYYSIQFDTFSVSLCSTKEHKIKTKKEWKQISQLQSNDLLYHYKYSMEKNIDYTQTKDTLVEAVKDYTLKFGSTIRAMFQKATMFIILTAIRIITILPIYLWFMVNYILDLKQKEDLKTIPNLQKSFTQKVLKKLKSGISQQKVESGIGNTLLQMGLEYLKKLKEYVLFVQKYLLQMLNIIKYALQNVNRNKEEIVGLTILQSNANIAVKNLKQTNIQELSIVHVNVGNSQEKQVYDLMVEDCHEYFANGILVHNCIDPIRYSLQSMTRTVQAPARNFKKTFDV